MKKKKLWIEKKWKKRAADANTTVVSSICKPIWRKPISLYGGQYRWCVYVVPRKLLNLNLIKLTLRSGIMHVQYLLLGAPFKIGIRL